MPSGAISRITLPESEWLRAHFRLDRYGRIVHRRKTHAYYTGRNQVIKGTNANGSLVMKIKGRQVPMHRVVRVLKGET